MNRIFGLKGRIVRIMAAGVLGFLFGICFLSGIAFLAGYQIYYETSESMQPVIRKGSLLLVKEYEIYGPGDIVAFYTWYEGEKLCVTHRIVRELAEDAYVTKGDANCQEDREVVKKGDIMGKVVGYIPYFGYVCFWLKDNCVFLVLLLAAGLLRVHALFLEEKI